MPSRRFVLSAALAGMTALALTALPQAQAQGTMSAPAANSFIQQFGNKLIGIVNSATNPAQKQRELAPAIDSNVAVDTIGQFCLGRFWRLATPAQQKQYLGLFHTVLLNSITGHLGEYAGVSYTMTTTQERNGDAYVGTVVHRPGAADADVQWVVGSESGQPKVVDVIAEGTSLRLTQRSDYASFLSRNNNNVQALIDAMKRQTES